MKKLQIITAIITVFIFCACTDEYIETFTANSPIYLSYDELRSAVKTTEAKTIKNTGKIYFNDNYIFIVEKLEGIHIIDISSPSNPINKAFVTVPGCIDIAIKDNILYTDSYVDLVAIDVSNINNIKETSRVKSIFPYSIPPIKNNLRIENIDPTKGVIISWEIKKIKKENSYPHYPNYPIYWFSSKISSTDNTAFSVGVGNSTTSTFGKSGSLARFGLNGKYLYAADNNGVYIFNLNTPTHPIPTEIKYQNISIETIFMYDNKMFVGTNDGMIIYSLEIPITPTLLSYYYHITSCDPVIVDNGYAYVTLRGGVTCRNTAVNELQVLQLSSDYKTITPVEFYPMTNPHGLGIDGNTLFVCDGSAGLKVFNCFDKKNITANSIATFSNIQATDIIPLSDKKLLFMIGNDGFYIYDYNNLSDIKLLSNINITK